MMKISIYFNIMQKEVKNNDDYVIYILTTPADSTFWELDFFFFLERPDPKK
jgi:hypothetical protein